MSREIAPFVAAMLLAAASVASAQDSHFRPDRQQIPTPGCLIMTGAWEGGSKSCSQNEHDAWLADIRHWGDERRIRVGYDGSRYDLPALKWTQSSFFQPQMMVEDRYFYDPVAHKYTVDRYLDDLEKRYGGIDAVLIWPTYPNMGIDNGNQHDMILAMPGGVAGVRQMIADFHRRGVRVLFPMMMWDQGTRQPEQLGIWNGITPRAAEGTRRGAAIDPAFAPFFVSGGWEPMVPTLRYGVYASRWPHGEQTLFKAVNRNEYDVDGDQWRSDESSCNPGSALFRFLPRRRAQAGCTGCGALVDSVSRSKPKGTEPSSQPTGN